MSKVPVTYEYLCNLATHARRVGTLDAFADVALQWAGLAEKEIERLRAENHNLNWALGTEGYEQMATPEEQAEHDKAVHAHNEFLARLEKGKTVYEELKADAERYRWLRANRQFCAAAYPDGEWAIPAGMVFLGSDNDNADAWIDARIAQADKAMGSDHA